MGIIGASSRRVRAVSTSIVVDLTSDPKPETFAEMKSMLVQGRARTYTVQHDEFHGVDQNPIYFNGEKIFAFGVIIDEEEQPIFN